MAASVPISAASWTSSPRFSIMQLFYHLPHAIKVVFPNIVFKNPKPCTTFHFLTFFWSWLWFQQLHRKCALFLHLCSTLWSFPYEIQILQGSFDQVKPLICDLFYPREATFFFFFVFSLNIQWIMWIKFEQLTEERMLKNTTKTKRANSNTPERSRSPEYFWKQLRSLLYKRVSKGNVMIGKIVFTRSLGFGIQFHVRKVFLLGGGNVAAESELELPVSCDLKFIKGIWKVIFFF